MELKEETSIQIKANKDGFVLVPHPSASFEAILAELEERLGASKDFFLRSDMILDLRKRPLETEQIAALHAMLRAKGRVRLVEVQLADDLNLYVDRPSQRVPPTAPTRQEPAREIYEGAPVVVRTTCRSGMRVESPSDCVILGDVNPGAEVLAVGDIVVFGNLRGVAHAGALGDRSARIWALSIEASQVRIADLVAIPSKGDKSIAKRYEIAEVRGDLIELITL